MRPMGVHMSGMSMTGSYPTPTGFVADAAWSGRCRDGDVGRGSAIMRAMVPTHG